MQAAIEDLKSLRNWTLGIIGFATAVATVLVQALHFRPEPTIIAVAGFACALLLIVILIQRSEDRQKRLLESHISHSDEQNQTFATRLDSIDKVLLDIQKSTLRTELCNEIARNPSNHDTIIKMGEKYFNELVGDWTMTDTYAAWMEEEEKAGRKVHLPPELLMSVNRRLAEER